MSNVEKVQKLRQILEATARKISNADSLNKEYHALEQVPPMPGRPRHQHDAMVQQGLANDGVKFTTFNRYCNQYPFDTHLVRVSGLPYINASWIKIPSCKENPYIITIGPLNPKEIQFKCEETRGHFWKMVWGVQTEVVVMLCQIQSGFTGCPRYFPMEKGEKEIFGDFEVCLESIEERDGFCKRKLTISEIRTGNSREIVHFQFLLWPNYGAPDGVIELTNMLEEAAKYERTSGGKGGDQVADMVIHCSGGLGRSGTFLATLIVYRFLANFVKTGEWNEMLAKCINDNHELSLNPVIWTMRLQRHPWMVEGTQQLLIAYKAILQLITNLIAFN